MPNKPLPTDLTELHLSNQAALLWDNDRQRLVWANRAGVKAFHARSLFEAIDRQFDPDDAALKQLAELAQTLHHGETRKQNIEFTSPQNPVSLQASISLHALSDGRQGLLVVETDTTPPAATTSISDEAMALLPAAVVYLTKDGSLAQPNQRAQAILPAVKTLRLADFILDKGLADRIMSQLQSQALVDCTAQTNCAIGRREVRIILSKIGHETILAVATLEDITDRRNLELMLEEKAQAERPATAKLSKPDAMDQLAISMANSLQNTETPAPSPKHPATRAPAAKIEQQAAPAKPIPAVIRAMAEKTGQPLLIVKNGKVAFANELAARELKINSGDEVPVWLQKALEQPSENRPVIATMDANGDGTTVQVVSKQWPWIDGPACHVTIRKIAATEPAKEPGADQPQPAAPKRNVAPAAAIGATIGAIKSSLLVSETSAPPAPNPVAVRPLDASQHIEPNDELKAILDIASDGIVTLDADGNILSMSAGAEAIFSRNLASVTGKPMADLFAPEGRKTWLDYLSALQGAGLASIFNDGREVLALLDNGGTVPLFLTMGRLQSPNSSARFCAVVRDITPWKRTEKELRDARDQAEAASHQKSVFLAHLSHELRTPLNAILGFSEVMRLERFGALSNDKYKDYASDIHASGQHLMALIDDLLDLSRIESGKLELSFAAVDLVDIVEHAMRMLQEDATLQQVILRKSFGQNLPRVVADQKSMHQVILNLISNAIKFTEPGGQVIVSAGTNAEGELTLTINDNGIGMNAEQVRDALQPYKRITTQGRETQGTGLGLPLARALAEANRAHFELTSEPGEGTLVEITFPTTRVLAA